MTWLLDFIHARKWLVELIVLGLIGAGLWWLHHHIYEQGVQAERDRWEAKLAEQKSADDIRFGKEQGKAEVAEKQRADTQTQLDKFVADNPLHGGLCQQPKPARLSPAASNGSNAGTSSATPGVQQMSEGDHIGGQEIDQLGLLGALAARGDRLSAQVKEWQAR